MVVGGGFEIVEDLFCQAFRVEAAIRLDWPLPKPPARYIRTVLIGVNCAPSKEPMLRH